MKFFFLLNNDKYICIKGLLEDCYFVRKLCYIGVKNRGTINHLSTFSLNAKIFFVASP